MRVRKIIHDDSINEWGIYCVHLVKNGVKQQICVDDYIVCKNSEPVFTRAHGNELWVLIVEKAWAKIHGSFDRIIAGQAHLTMRDFTGAPGYSFNIEKTPDLPNMIVDWDQKDFIIAIGLDDSKKSTEGLKALGLITKHSYCLLSAAYIQDASGNNVYLC